MNQFDAFLIESNPATGLGWAPKVSAWTAKSLYEFADTLIGRGGGEGFTVSSRHKSSADGKFDMIKVHKHRAEA